jgi:hypothetical protein
MAWPVAVDPSRPVVRPDCLPKLLMSHMSQQSLRSPYMTSAGPSSRPVRPQIHGWARRLYGPHLPVRYTLRIGGLSAQHAASSAQSRSGRQSAEGRTRPIRMIRVVACFASDPPAAQAARRRKRPDSHGRRAGAQSPGRGRSGPPDPSRPSHRIVRVSPASRVAARPQRAETRGGRAAANAAADGISLRHGRRVG